MEKQRKRTDRPGRYSLRPWHMLVQSARLHISLPALIPASTIEADQGESANRHSMIGRAFVPLCVLRRPRCQVPETTPCQPPGPTSFGPTAAGLDRMVIAASNRTPGHAQRPRLFRSGNRRWPYQFSSRWPARSCPSSTLGEWPLRSTQKATAAAAATKSNAQTIS